MKKNLQEKGIEASNQDFREFEQVNKPQNYQLTENQGDEEFDTDYVIPTCDMEQFFSGGEDGRKAFSIHDLQQRSTISSIIRDESSSR